ncbi:ATP-grasp domain-containing protein [Duganella sp. FT3S]|uniref:ATP-grasp domain-containing protein n=1 Tax=Rugamonas fusca TaxID=2758568 RepID=A0A7W2EMQ8_9BURK|nr:ATP-grasp domain-containing protein [Rugamonas fusca]MBA5608605.1 ATP-grasp domain-containing protein [Rugamonas fusca]
MPKTDQPSGATQSTTLPDDGAALLRSVQFVDAELRRLEHQAAILRTARHAYGERLTALGIAVPAGHAGAAPAVPQPLSEAPATAAPPQAPKVLLVTHDWSTLAEMAWLAKQAGCQVHVLCPHNNAAIKNSFHDRWFDSGPTLDTLLAALRALAGQRSYQYILIGDDPILWRIYRDRLEDLWPLLPILDHAALPMLGKAGFAALCRDHGVSSPRFEVVTRAAEAPAALQSLGLPVVVKENYSNGGAGVRIFRDAPAYAQCMAAYDYAEPLLVQQFIDGELLSMDALFKRGKLLQYACAVDVEPTLGPSTKRRYFPNDEPIGALLRRLGQAATLHGFANISILRERDSQRCYLIEADPRPTKWVSCTRWFGHDIVAAFRAFLAGDDADVEVPEADYAAVDCWEVEYFPNHLAKLLNEGRTQEAILHLLDFKRNARHTIYDPVLLEEKMDCIRRGLRFT